jgi:hypothetical protein
MFDIVVVFAAIGSTAAIWARRSGPWLRVPATLFLMLCAVVTLEGGLGTAPRRTGVPEALRDVHEVQLGLAWETVGSSFQRAVGEGVWVVGVILVSLTAIAAIPTSGRKHRTLRQPGTDAQSSGDGGSCERRCKQ